MSNRRSSRRIHIGRVAVGGGAPIAVQSMTNTPTADIAATVRQIRRLEAAGCEIVRVAVPDRAAAEAIGRIKAEVSLPVVADIHFDHRLAVRAARAGADALRINPGNIGAASRVREVVACARDRGIPIRIGVNAGSLEKSIVRQYHGVTAEGMVESALRHIDRIRSWDFHDLKVSLKASDVPRTVAAYRLIARKTDLPLHLGVTETGTLIGGLVKSALGIGILLAEGIGDTLRVSLTRDPAEEVRAGWEILRALDIRRRGPEIIACPTCGRTRIDLFGIVERVERELAPLRAPLKVAVMGCVVNGPGEAREADVGVAGGEGAGILFRKGKVVRRIREEDLAGALIEEARRLAAEWPEAPGGAPEGSSTTPQNGRNP
ncbi:MAG: flavodoxin-dependent (E)-4-hydroxy-3-methylbut-2-enyl-diphosphate synthase [Desulfobacterales bacterium]